MTHHIVREIVAAAKGSAIRIQNEFHILYHYHPRTANYMLKLDNCKKVLGGLPKPDLEFILARLKGGAA